MRVLFDQGTPSPLRRFLDGHVVTTAFELGWQRLRNGELLAQAEAAGFELLITTDQNLKYQQNLSGRQIAVLVLNTTSWPRIQIGVTVVLSAVNKARAGSFVEVAVP